MGRGVTIVLRLAVRLAHALLAQEAGSVVLVFALATPLIVGGAAMATDAALILQQRTRLQSVADSAALAGAKELHLYDTKVNTLKDAVAARALALLREQKFADPSPPISVAIDTKKSTVSVTVEVSPHTFLLGRFGYGETLAATAVAGAFGSAKLCVLALHGSGEAIGVTRNAQIDAAACAVQSNSTDPDSIAATLLGTVKAKAICSSGGVSGSNLAFDPEPQTDCPAIEDPLSSRGAPALGGCDFTNKKVMLGLHTISPGRYCGGLTLLPGALVAAAPGDYIFTGGPLTLGLASSLTGDGVSFRFADNQSTFTFGLGSIVRLSAPRQGPMAGFLFYQDRTSGPPGEFLVASDLVTELIGTVYLPNGVFKANVVGLIAADSAYTVIVADSLDIQGARLVINSDYGATDVPVPAGVGPTAGQVALSK
jgi:Flp pilus assembly protein TadG